MVKHKKFFMRSLFVGWLFCASLPINSLVFSEDAAAAAATAYEVSGKPFHLPESGNKWVVINYWADWCSACIREIPELNRFAQLSNRSVVFFAINFDQMPAASQMDFARKYGVTYPLLRSNPLRSYIPEETITSLPMTYLISPQGEVKQLYGEQTAENLLQMLS